MLRVSRKIRGHSTLHALDVSANRSDHFLPKSINSDDPCYPCYGRIARMKDNQRFFERFLPGLPQKVLKPGP